jgi:predicted lipoprotein with Yx(FWY)xxD motif
MRWKTILAVTLVAGLAACGGSGTTTTAGPGTTSTPTTTAAPSTTAPSDTTAAPSGAVVAAADTDLGTILTDGEGFTLYTYQPDDGGGVATCAGGCQAAWPPAPAASAGDGVDASLLGTTDDGSQATYNGWPLYYYASDSAPSDTNGQGVGGVWSVMDAGGERVSG